MGAANFTSGPWSTSESGREPVVDADGNGVISACGCCDGISARPEDLALIAAAPELYAALSAFIRCGDFDIEQRAAIRPAALAALSKAEGRAVTRSRVAPGEPDPRD